MTDKGQSVGLRRILLAILNIAVFFVGACPVLRCRNGTS
jgi:hypothetical protein